MDRLIAGPWIGEFGWELFNWHARIRYLSEYYVDTLVVCRENSAYLYEDFANDFVFIDTGDLPTENNVCHGWEWKNYENLIKDRKWENPKNLSFFLDGGVPTIGNKRQKFIKFGNSKKTEAQIIIHARNTNKCDTGYRDWPKINWEKFVEVFSNQYQIICIGTNSQSLHIENTIDLRNAPLELVSNTISNSKCIVGPSSGPIHLASLCGIPQIVWSGHYRNKYRYEKLWNPFKTKVIYIDNGGWQPSVELIINKTMDIL